MSLNINEPPATTTSLKNESEINSDDDSTTEYTLCPGKSIKTKSFVNKRIKNILNLKESDYEALSREHLISECIRLQRHVNQLKNLLNKTEV